ncbi:MAG: phospholipid carrier-dependent glycosyltransferase [Oligoflexia bacterium]|nr:phospholipid carrier-dependent glycosyltransferase [Oligoflexia bacterium]
MTETRSSSGTILLLLALALVPFVYLCGLLPVGSSTEARELLVIDTILRDHAWLLPLRNGQVPSKPPLYHWLNAIISFPVGAASVWLARLLSALLGGLTVYSTALIADAVGGRRPRLTLLSAALLLSTYGFVKLMGEARVDMLFAFLNTLAMFIVLRRFVPDFTSRTGRLIPLEDLDLNLFYAICGISVLARGPLGIVLPLLSLGAVLIYTAGFRAAVVYLLRPRAGWFIAAAIFLPWYCSAFFRGGDAFINRQLIFENMRRFFGGEQVNTEVWWFYLPSLLRTAFPVSLLFLIFHRRLRDPQARIISIWFWTGFLFFSLASGKRHSYLLPLYPACAVFAALYLEQWLSRLSDRSGERLRSIARALNPGTIFAGAILVLEALRVFDEFHNPAVLNAKISFNLILVRTELLLSACGVVMLALSMLPSARAYYRSPVLSWSAILIVFYAAILLGDGFKNQLKEYPAQSAALAAAIPANQKLVVMKSEWDESFDVLLYYLKRPVIVHPPDAQPLPGLLLASRSWIDTQRVKWVQAGWSMQERLKLSSSYDRVLGRVEREKILLELVRSGPRQ